MTDNKKITQFSIDYNKATKIIMQFLRELTGEQNEAKLEHNAKCIIARLASENLLIESVKP